MLAYLRLVQKYGPVQPRTFWYEFPFFVMVSGFRQRLCLGQRPEDLDQVETIEQKAWEKHHAYVNRLERFPLEKAEYYLRLKEAHEVHLQTGAPTEFAPLGPGFGGGERSSSLHPLD